ncbi:MAG: TIM-barrel domain-containing protein [Sporolactobacillus sp.]
MVTKFIKRFLTLTLAALLAVSLMMFAPVQVHADAASTADLSLNAQKLLTVDGDKGHTYTPVQNSQGKNDGIKISLSNGNYEAYIRILQSSMVKVSILKKGQSEQNSPAIAKTDWQVPSYAISEDADTITIATDTINIIVKKDPFGLKYTDKQGHVIDQDDTNNDDGGYGAGYDASGKPFVYKKTDPNDKEAYYGFGERGGDLNKYGENMTLWNKDQYEYNNTYDNLYTSIPFFIGLKDQKAYGIYFDNTYKTHFNMNADSNGYYYFYADGGPLTYYFIYGPGVQDVINSYTDLTGKMNRPPMWSLGFQQSKYGYTPDELVDVAKTYRKKNIPLDTMVFDINYMDDYRVFTWDSQYKNALKTLKNMGLRAVTIVDPGVKKDPGYTVYDEGEKNNYFAKNPDGTDYVGTVWPGDAVFPNFSDSVVRDWWGSHLKTALLDNGVDGIWNDMNEPSVFNGPDGTVPLDVSFGNIKSDAFHNIFAHEEDHATYDGEIAAKPNQRPFVLSRDMFAGTQRYSAIWTGDNVSDWEHLAVSLPMNENIGLSGQPFVGNDIGGFAGPHPSDELFARWIEVGSLLPFARDHYSNDKTQGQEPWQFSTDVETISRKYIDFRYQLLPYLYDAFVTASETGSPVQQPLVYQFQNDPNVYNLNDQYMLGDRLMVAPVVTQGQTSRQVYLPEGTDWVDYWTGKSYTGGQTITKSADLSTLPIFVKADSIIPTRDVQQSTEEKPLTNLILDSYLSDHAQNVFYEDDGETFNYQKGEYNTTQFNLNRSGRTITFTQNKTKTGYNSKLATYTLKLHNTIRPYAVTAGSNNYVQVGNQSDLDQHDRATYFDSDTNTLYVKIPASESQKVEITDPASDREAEAAVVKAETSQSQDDVNAATVLVSQLSSDSNAKTDLMVRLVKVQKEIDENLDQNAAVDAVIKAETSLSQNDVDAATGLVNKLSSGDLKDLLLQHLTTVQQAINQKAAPAQLAPDQKVLFTGYLTKSHAIRTAASVSAPIIGHLAKSAAVQVLNTGKWDQILYKGKAAYVYGDISKARPVRYTAYLTHKHAIRTGASNHAHAVATLAAGSSVKVLQQGQLWTLISYKGSNRYVWAKDLKKAQYTGTVTKKQAFRSAKSKKAHILRRLKKGTKVKVLSDGNQWDQTVYKGKLGYVWRSGIRK